MKKLVRLTESDLHRIIKNSVNNILKESDNPYNKGYYSSNGNGVITDMLGVTYEEVKKVYNALYGYQNYDGSKNEEFEQGINEWWNTILSNARRQNANSNLDKLSRTVNRRNKSFKRKN